MRRVLVTGGGTGIGQGIARAFAEAGDAVTIAGRRAEALGAVDPEGQMAHAVADVTDEASVAALFETPFDVVVANAGMGTAAPLTETSLDAWNRMIDVNLTGTFLTFREGLRGMGQGGRLIAVASTQGLKGGGRIAGYSASKHGVIGLVRSVAHEVAKQGITCNAICPGFTATDLAETGIQNTMKGLGLDRQAAVDMIVAPNPMRRMIEVEEVAAVALFLASAGASSVNGHALSVSGGEI